MKSKIFTDIDISKNKRNDMAIPEIKWRYRSIFTNTKGRANQNNSKAICRMQPNVVVCGRSDFVTRI